ncbi:MAG: c-type cytochrome [Steroidobacteraceae bacterium]
MSKQDTHFFNVFSLVIGLLVVVAILIFAFARALGKDTQLAETYSDPMYQASVAERVKPFVRVAVAGKDNTALTIKAPVGATQVALAVPKDGKELYEGVCKACHGTGLAGAPKAGDKSAWGSRLAEGKPALYEHALKGYTGKTGVMPVKGGRTDLSDDLIKQGVDYLTSLAQ